MGNPPLSSMIFANKNTHTYIYPSITGWWFGTFFIVPYIGNVIIPTDELIFFFIFFRGVGGSTTNQINTVFPYVFFPIFFLVFPIYLWGIPMDFPWISQRPAPMKFQRRLCRSWVLLVMDIALTSCWAAQM